MRLTNKELERQLYMANDALHKVIGELVDLEEENRDLIQENDSLEQEVYDLKYNQFNF